MRILQNNGCKSVGSKALGGCLLFLAGLTFLACPPEPSADTVESVTVSPANPSVVKGKTQAFTATVHGTGNLDQTVTWDVEGEQSSGTNITSAGILTVAADEAASSLTVRATSTQDTTKSGTTTVTVTAPPPPAGTVERVTVSMTNPSPSVVKGSSYNFSAEVIKGTGSPDLTVTWSVDGGEGTSIDEHGVLTVAADETAATLTIRAASTQDAAKFGELTVMVADDDEEGEKTDFTVGAADFPIVMKSICDKPGTYTVTLTEDVINYGGVTIIDGVKITVNGGDNEIVWKHDPLVDADLFAIRGGHLVVSNIKLRHAENIENWALISNIGSGTIEIKDGVILTGDEEAPDSDGVYLEGGTFTMSGGEISGLRNGILLYGDEIKLNISGGTIKDNGSGGVSVLGNGNTVTVTGGTFSGNYYDGLWVGSTDCVITISGGNFINNGNEDGGSGVGIQGSGNTVTITGGTFSGNSHNGISFSEATNCELIISGGTFKDHGYDGVSIQGTQNTVTVTGGAFSGNSHNGIWVGSTDCELTISGGTFEDNVSNISNGVGISGTENTITISGGEIRNNEGGISFWEAIDCTLTIEDKAIISNNSNTGIGVWDSNRNIKIIMLGGEIKDNESDWAAVAIQGKNNNFIMKGGIISGNAGRGLVFEDCSGSSFEKTGGVIYGDDAGDNSNLGGAISLLYQIELKRTTDESEQLAATTNDDGTGIASKEGNWD